MNPMNLVVLVLAAGALLGGGVALLVSTLGRPHPELVTTLDRLAGRTRDPRADLPADADRLTRWGWRWQQRVQTLPLAPVPADLAIMRKSPAQFAGERIQWSGLGFLAGVYFSFMLHLNIVIALLLTAGFAAAGWWAPLRRLSEAAADRRLEFRRAMGSYVDLVALERRAGVGPDQALMEAADVADGWVFRRIQDVYTRAKLAGDSTWDALSRLGADIDLADLSDLGARMALGGEKGTVVYTALRAKADSLRQELLEADRASAGSRTSAMVGPAMLIALTFICGVTLPLVLSLLAGRSSL